MQVKWQSEGHLRNIKTSRGSYLDPEQNIFVQKFEFYLVTQSLQIEFDWPTRGGRQMRQEMSQIQTIIWVTLHTRSCTWGMNKPNPIKKSLFLSSRACGTENRYCSMRHSEVCLKFVKEEWLSEDNEKSLRPIILVLDLQHCHFINIVRQRGR